MKGFCPWCGSPLTPGFLYCESCGTRITEQEPTYPPVTAPSTRLQQPKRTSPAAAAFAGFLIGALLTFMLLLFIGGTTSTQTVFGRQTVTVTTTAVRMTTVVPAGVVEPPYTLIQNGKVVWRFRDLSGRILRWNMDIDTYKSYAEYPKDKVTTTVHSKDLDRDFLIDDIRPYIKPSFFANVIGELTTGSAQDFVREVDNIKNQIVVYGSGLSEGYYQWPAETLTEGRGRCGDTTILMASMLIAGNNQAHYGMKIQAWYVDSTVKDQVRGTIGGPNIPDHALLSVEFADGEWWALETTSTQFMRWNSVHGWSFDVTETP